MRLSPTTTETTTQYPTKKATLSRTTTGRWVRRVGAVACATTAFWLSGCLIHGGGEPAGPEYFYDGVCEEGWTADQGELEYPGNFHGCMEANEEAFGTLNVEEQISLRFRFSEAGLQSPEAITADLIDPEDTVVATVTFDEPVQLDLSPGEWTVVVNSSDPEEGAFNLVIELAE